MYLHTSCKEYVEFISVYLSGKNMCQGGKPDTGKLHSSYIGTYVAPPMRMGAWSMACVLRQQIEYYYYLYFLKSIFEVS